MTSLSSFHLHCKGCISAKTLVAIVTVHIYELPSLTEMPFVTCTLKERKPSPSLLNTVIFHNQPVAELVVGVGGGGSW